jgi:hypothetical protein
MICRTIYMLLAAAPSAVSLLESAETADHALAPSSHHEASTSPPEIMNRWSPCIDQPHTAAAVPHFYENFCRLCWVQHWQAELSKYRPTPLMHPSRTGPTNANPTEPQKTPQNPQNPTEPQKPSRLSHTLQLHSPAHLNMWQLVLPGLRAARAA